MKYDLEKKIYDLVCLRGKKGVHFKDITRTFHIEKKDHNKIDESIEILEKKGSIIKIDKKYYKPEFCKGEKCRVIRVNKTFGFVEDCGTNEEVFIPGKYLKGSVPEDIVYIQYMESRGNSKEGKILYVTEKSDYAFLGRIVKEGNNLMVLPESLTKSFLKIAETNGVEIKEGDQVYCNIIERGESHRDHKLSIIKNYGNSNKAEDICKMHIDSNRIETTFSKEVLEESKKIAELRIEQRDYEKRQDLRGEKIFTIDSSHSKDLDDAVSLEMMGEYYRLGVHIADVSHYIKHGSILDKEAEKRGTSVYYANKVIPMLPTELSNDVCSLNPNEDKLTFSIFIVLDSKGKIIDFEIKKTIIQSVVKGIYSEINDIFKDQASEDIIKKYELIKDNLFLMKELAEILGKNRSKRGCSEIESGESYMIIGDSGEIEDIKVRKQGTSERLVEEFMVIANEVAATISRIKEVPFLYRVHDKPKEEKVAILKEVLEKIGVTNTGLKDGKHPSEMANLLKNIESENILKIINRQVLRTMSKAKYSDNPIGHYGLALENYSHFTSPIRRYPDLVIHRVLGDIVDGFPIGGIVKKYSKFISNVGKESTESEIKATKIERKCQDYYKAEYMSKKVGEEFEGVISSVCDHGIYVELENTVEGLVKLENFPEGKFVFDGYISFFDELSGKRLKVGDKTKIVCISSNVSIGKIDFKFI